MKKDFMSEEALDERNKVISFFDRLGWEPDESNQLFDQGEEVDFEAEFSREHDDQLITVQYDAEQRGLILSIDGLSNSVTFLFDVRQKINRLLSIFKKLINEVKLDYYELLIEKVINEGIKVFRLKNGNFVGVFLQNEKMKISENIQKFFDENGWASIEIVNESSDNSRSKNYESSFCYYNKDFGMFVDINIDDMVMCNRLYYINDGQLFSHLYIYSSQFNKTIRKIDQWKDKLKKENYNTFVKELMKIADKVTFNNNGTLLDLNTNG